MFHDPSVSEICGVTFVGSEHVEEGSYIYLRLQL